MRMSDFPQVIFKSSTIKDKNMSTVHEDPKKVVQHRKQFLEKYKLSLNDCVNMFVEHEDKVTVVDKSDCKKGIFEDKNGIITDGLCTNQKNLIIMLVTGDCLPIGLYDPKKEAIALLHGSKKSLQKGIVKTGIKIMKESFSSNAHDLIVEIGPSIGPCCYNSNLWKLTEEELQYLGVLKENIYNQKFCTYHEDKHFSHRKYINEHLANDSRILTIFSLHNL